MNILIIHISDIHLKKEGNHILEKLDHFFNSIKNYGRNKKKIFLAITGDTAYSGVAEEYKIFEENFLPIISKIESYCDRKVEIVIIPGNHDCDFSVDKETRELLLQSVINKPEKLTESILKNILNVQNEYFAFHDRNTDKENTIYNSELITVSSYDIDGYEINFMKYNTAWSSQLKENPGHMLFPILKVKEHIPISKTGINLSLIHHPLNWQNPMNSRVFKEYLEKSSTFILSGHEHVGTAKKIESLNEDNSCFVVEAPVFQENSSDKISGFNLIEICTSKKEFKVSIGEWKRTRYEILEGAIQKVDFQKKQLKHQINESFQNFLNDPGAEFTHSHYQNLRLNDIYVEPLLIKLFGDRKKKREYCQFNQGFINSNLLIALLGPESSGKTVLCKKLFYHHYLNSKIPIYFNGNELKDITTDKLIKFIKQKFIAIYSNVSDSDFNEIGADEFIIIIDNYHLVKYNNKFKAVLLRNLQMQFPNVIYTGSDLMQFEIFIEESDDHTDISSAFSYYNIAQFGPAKRNELIQKWSLLGRDSQLEYNEFLQVVDSQTNMVNNLIGRNIVQSYPFYLLCILQINEAGQIGNNSISMHGYYYEHLILSSLNKSIDDNNDIGFIRNFMTNYCFFLFEEEIRFNSITEADFDKYIDAFNKKMLSTESKNKIKTILGKAKLIRITENEVSVHHKYIYYYFVASYLTRNISKPEIRETIIKLCERLFIEEFSNIIMFLTHLTNDSIVLDELIKNSKNCFKEYKEVELGEDVAFLNEYINKIPEKVLSLQDLSKQYREEQLFFEDEKERTEREFEEQGMSNYDYSIKEEISSLDGISKIVRALKSVDLLGQITKKYWGEIEGPRKLELITEAYNAGLRTLGFYFESLKGNQEHLAQYVRKIIISKEDANELSKVKIEDYSRKIIFQLASMSTFGIIKRISDSIGNEKLATIYPAILEKNDTNAIRLINLAVELEHLKGFPYQNIKSEAKRIEKYLLPYSVLRNLVFNYANFFNTTIGQKQQIAELFNVEVQDLRRISLTAKEKKDSKKL